MYLTAHRVVRERDGAVGINSFMHVHDGKLTWPEEPWRLPEENPGRVVDQQIDVPPGGNRVRAYLDVVAPDGAGAGEVEASLNGLWLELVADEATALEHGRMIPNPVVLSRAELVIRFGVELSLEQDRPLELAALQEVLLQLWSRYRASQQ